MKILGRLRSFGAFWYDFLVGDDWQVALGVVLALTATAALSHATSLPLWWLLPLYVVIALPVSIHRGTRHRH